MITLSRLPGVAVFLMSFSLAAMAQNDHVDSAANPATVTAAIEKKSRNELEMAYKKEFAFLTAQKRQLEKRQQSLHSQSEREVTAIKKTLAKLENQYVAVTNAAETLNVVIHQSEQNISTTEENQQILDATFTQANNTLSDLGFAPTISGGTKVLDGDKVARLFSVVDNAIARLSAVYKVRGMFFTQDGTRVNGAIVKVGRIAAYGISDKGSGILAPAGGGELKIWSQAASDVAEALAKGKSPERLKIFLFESLARAVNEGDESSLWATVNKGGTVGWIIVVLGGLALLMVVLRVIFLRRASMNTVSISDEVGELVRQGKIEQALSVCHNTQTAISRVLAATVRNLSRSREHLEDIISENILYESHTLNRFNTFVLVIAGIAPLLGLLGTVTGMITTFDIITEFGTGDPKLLSGGISVALVTTQLGLVVAIPTLLVGSLLAGWANRIKDDMERVALRISNIHEVQASEDDIAGFGALTAAAV